MPEYASLDDHVYVRCSFDNKYVLLSNSSNTGTQTIDIEFDAKIMQETLDPPSIFFSSILIRE